MKGVKQITRDGLFKANLVTDGSRIYFTRFLQGHLGVGQVSTAGGETLALNTSFLNTNVLDISPDHSALLVAEYAGSAPSQFWSMPLPTGSLRRLADADGKEAHWSPDGQQLAYVHGLDLYLADADGSHSRKLRTFSEIPGYVRFSPDGRRLRFTLTPAGKSTSSLWEMKVNGSDLHPLFPGWGPTRLCTTAPGVVMAVTTFSWCRRLPVPGTCGGRASTRTHGSVSASPCRLPPGPLWYSDPVFAPQGDRPFVNGILLGELVRYDAASRQFVSFGSGVSAGEADFSPDGQWIVYVSYPDLTLWCARIDGTQKTQLTFWPLYATLPRWSPDGKQIAFVGTEAGKAWKIYLVSPQGGAPQELLPQDRAENDATWSPDISRIAFGRMSYGLDLGELEIQLFDRSTKQMSAISRFARSLQSAVVSRWPSSGGAFT